MARYEVWCPSCDVSFPVETKRCLHCGQRTVAERPARAKMQRRGSGRGAPYASISPAFAPEDVGIELADAQRPLDEVEEESPRRSMLRAGMSILWMVLLAAGYIWQNCAGNPA